jgi:hypothetical protein
VQVNEQGKPSSRRNLDENLPICFRLGILVLHWLVSAEAKNGNSSPAGQIYQYLYYAACGNRMFDF